MQRCSDFDISEGFGYIYVTNSGNSILETTFNLIGNRGIKLRKPFRT